MSLEQEEQICTSHRRCVLRVEYPHLTQRIKHCEELLFTLINDVYYLYTK